MARIIVFQHGPNQTPGRLGLTLRDHGFKLDIRRPDLPAAQGGGTAAVPRDLDDVHGVISLGGLQNVTDNLPWLNAEINFLRAAHEAQLPVVGICLGHQAIAKALGGEVGPMDAPEFGFCPVSLTVPAHTDRIFAGVRWDTHQFQSHGQEVKALPPGATLLATSKACKVQAFTAGLRTYGFQYHFEADRAAIGTFLSESSETCARAGCSADQISAQCDKHYDVFARLADRLCVNIAAFAFTAEELLKA